ncbi:MAG: NAD-dependent succinate-semialdehyde dehydrogenase [Nevskiales bacterium]|nr:NAD-dependent succinate-semialdehyde dehydrogenase [Nevskiales bacterium]
MSSPDRVLRSVNPMTGAAVAEFPILPSAERDRILSAARVAQKAWARQSIAERARPLHKAAALLRERADNYARVMALEMGKPLRDGTAEVNKCARACEHYAEHAASYLAPREHRIETARSQVRFDPLGVVLAVMPWNFPFWQVFRFLAPNLMAGNGGVLKHASNVPQCALAIETVVSEAGFPPDLFRSLLLDSSAVASLIADPRIAAVTLTGSEAAGRAVAEAAGRALKPVVLELGGSDPFIVLADAEVPRAAQAAAQARCINAGQSCIAAKRFIVAEAVYDDFLEHFVTAMQNLRMGDPLDPATDMGPQARRDLRDALHRQVEAAIAQGARLVLGGAVPPGPGAFYPPTVLAEVGTGNVACREEVFGPVAAVIRARDEDDALRIANDSRFGLGASVWTANPEAAAWWAPRLEAGLVFINGQVRSDPRLPFGGVKASGVGRELGPEGLRAFVNVKTVCVG